MGRAVHTASGRGVLGASDRAQLVEASTTANEGATESPFRTHAPVILSFRSSLDREMEKPAVILRASARADRGYRRFRVEGGSRKVLHILIHALQSYDCLSNTLSHHPSAPSVSGCASSPLVTLTAGVDV